METYTLRNKSLHSLKVFIYYIVLVQRLPTFDPGVNSQMKNAKSTLNYVEYRRYLRVHNIV